MFPADPYAYEHITFVRDRTERDLAHRELVRAARSASHVPATRSAVVSRLRVRLGEALVASGTAIAGPAEERAATGAIGCPT